MHPAQKAGLVFLVIVTAPFVIVAPYWAIQGHVSNTIVSVTLAVFFGALAREFLNADEDLFTPT